MKLRTWKYYIEQGFKGIAKNGLMSLASIIIVAACAFIVILSLCIITNIDYMLTQVESNVGIVLFMGDKPTDEQIMELKADIEKMDNVTGVVYKSAEEALRDYAEDTEISLDGFKEDNPLPRSLEITLNNINSQKSFLNKLEQVQWDFEEKVLGETTENKEPEVQSSTQSTSQVTTQVGAQPASQTAASAENPTQSATVAKVQAPGDSVQPSQTATQAQTAASQPNNLAVKNEAEPPTGISPNMPEVVSQATTETALGGEPVLGDADYEFKGIERIQHAQQLTNTLVTVDTIFKLVSIVIIAVLCVVAIGIIMNTIKLTVFIRKNEIGIMKYVGATDWFIRWPFIIEGVVIGIIGAAIPTVLCWLGYLKLSAMYSDNSLLRAIGLQLRDCNEIFMVIAPITIGVGILLGAVGSINSIRKHLKV